jgi:hypothetical protein
MSAWSKVAMVFAFARARKRWVLMPILMFMLLLGVLMVATQGSALAPFIYTLF